MEPVRPPLADADSMAALLLDRQLVTLPCSTSTPADSHFTVLSWNLLVQRYAADTGPEATHTPYCPLEFLAWPYRAGLIISAIDRYSPDVVCLQELACSEWASFEAQLAAAGYQCIRGNKFYSISANGEAPMFDGSVIG